MRNLSNAAKMAAFAQQSEEAWIVLLTISHQSFVEPIRVCSDPYEDLPNAGVRGVVSRGMEFVFVPFSVNLPQDDETGVSRATLSIDNISREIVAAVRTATSAITVDMEIVLSSDVDNVELTMPDYKLERVTYDAHTVTGDISMEYFEQEPFPARRFTPSDFPGIF